MTFDYFMERLRSFHPDLIGWNNNPESIGNNPQMALFQHGKRISPWLNRKIIKCLEMWTKDEYKWYFYLSEERAERLNLIASLLNDDDIFYLRTLIREEMTNDYHRRIIKHD